MRVSYISEQAVKDHIVDHLVRSDKHGHAQSDAIAVVETYAVVEHSVETFDMRERYRRQMEHQTQQQNKKQKVAQEPAASAAPSAIGARPSRAASRPEALPGAAAGGDASADALTRAAASMESMAGSVRGLMSAVQASQSGSDQLSDRGFLALGDGQTHNATPTLFSQSQLQELSASVGRAHTASRQITSMIVQFGRAIQTESNKLQLCKAEIDQLL